MLADATTKSDRAQCWKVPLLLIALAATFAALVNFHSPWINGPWYWKWPYRDPDVVPPARWYAWMLLATLPVIAAIALEPLAAAGSRVRRWATVAMLMVGAVAMKLMAVCVLTAQLSFFVLNLIIQDPFVTSYYTDAGRFANYANWLEIYPKVLEQTNLHTMSKPPGAVAFYRAFIVAQGSGANSAVTSGIVLAVMSALSIPAAMWLAREFTGDDRVATRAAFLMALCPGYAIMPPTFDAVWPVFTCALLVLWRRTVVRNDWRYAVTFGATFALACFATYNLLVLGAFLAAWTTWTLSASPVRPDSFRKRFVSILLHVGIALATTTALYAVFWLFTRFNPIATFAAAWRNQHALLERFKSFRPYPSTVVFDLTDFALGAGWLLVPLAALGVARWAAPRCWRATRGASASTSASAVTASPRELAMVVSLCIGIPLLVAVLGLLQSETARVWNFMLPLLILPAALELSRWPGWARQVVYGSMLVILLLVARHMRFMGP